MGALKRHASGIDKLEVTSVVPTPAVLEPGRPCAFRIGGDCAATRGLVPCKSGLFSPSSPTHPANHTLSLSLTSINKQVIHETWHREHVVLHGDQPVFVEHPRMTGEHDDDEVGKNKGRMAQAWFLSVVHISRSTCVARPLLCHLGHGGGGSTQRVKFMHTVVCFRRRAFRRWMADAWRWAASRSFGSRFVFVLSGLAGTRWSVLPDVSSRLVMRASEAAHEPSHFWRGLMLGWPTQVGSPTHPSPHQGGGVSAKCEVMPFCLKLATSKKGGGFYPFCAQLKFSKTRRGGLPWMCTSAYLPIFWACRRKFGGVLLQK